jgi:hypothetical protein
MARFGGYMTPGAPPVAQRVWVTAGEYQEERAGGSQRGVGMAVAPHALAPSAQLTAM